MRRDWPHTDPADILAPSRPGLQGLNESPKQRCVSAASLDMGTHVRVALAALFERADGMHDVVQERGHVNGDANPPLHGDALFSGMEIALTPRRQAAPEPGQGQAAAFCSLA